MLDDKKQEKIFWIESLLARNNRSLTPPLNLPNGLKSADGYIFRFEGGSFNAQEANYYLKYKTLDNVEKPDSERLTKREQVALHMIQFTDKSIEDGEEVIKESYRLADIFLKESNK